MQRQSRRKKRQAEFSLCIAKISQGLQNSLHSEIVARVFLMFLIPNDHVLINYHFVPIVTSYFRQFFHFTHWGWLYKLPYNFCNNNFTFY